jgi:hypothetical protein
MTKMIWFIDVGLCARDAGIVTASILSNGKERNKAG